MPTKDHLAHIPNMALEMTANIPSYSDTAEGTTAMSIAPHAGTILSAYFTPTAALGATASFHTMKVVNASSDGTGTVIIASSGASASSAAHLPIALTTQTNPTFDAGDVIYFETVSSHSDGRKQEGGMAEVRYRVIQPA